MQGILSASSKPGVLKVLRNTQGSPKLFHGLHEPKISFIIILRFSNSAIECWNCYSHPGLGIWGFTLSLAPCSSRWVLRSLSTSLGSPALPPIFNHEHLLPFALNLPTSLIPSSPLPFFSSDFLHCFPLVPSIFLSL